MTGKVVWTFQHNGDNTPNRKTFINGYVINLLDDGSLYYTQKDIYSKYKYQTIDDVTILELQDFIKTIKSV